MTPEVVSPETAAAADERALMRRAIRLVVGDQFGSLPRLMRRLAIDEDRAFEVMGLLEENGIVGPHRLGMSREVLATPDQMHARLSDWLEPGDPDEDERAR